MKNLYYNNYINLIYLWNSNIILLFRKDLYIKQITNKLPNEDAQKLSLYLISYNNPKKEKCALYWLLKGSIRLPEDQYKVDQAFNLILKQHLDYQQFSTPQEIINKQDSSTQRINAQDQLFNPDNESTFTNKKVLKNGITIYNVETSEEGQLAVRKAIDVNWGYDANPWCLTARQNGSLLKAKEHWFDTYNVYPKRITFKNNKLLAFCANDKKEIAWWNRDDKSSTNIPTLNNEDDPEWFNFLYNGVSLARNPNTPKLILLKLVNDQDLHIKHAIAENPNIPLNFLLKLANDLSIYVRHAVAENPNTPILILLKYANDLAEIVRSAVARNSNTSIKILLKLANDLNSVIRLYVAKNSNTQSLILLKLANDLKYYIRRTVAENLNTPINILLKLANDLSYSVRETAKFHLQKLK